MNKQLEKLDNEVVERFREFISTETDVKTLAKNLDEIIWDFIMYRMNDSSIAANSCDADMLWCLRRLHIALTINE